MNRAFETGGAYVAEVDLPGVRKDDISVELADGMLTVTVPKAETDKPLRIEVTGG